jgi:hypothetical protein
VKLERAGRPFPVSFPEATLITTDFMAGNYQHIIFNLSLQEGWDDPACCFLRISTRRWVRLTKSLK